MVLVGSGKLQGSIMDQVRKLSLGKNIRFLGAKKPEEIPYYYNAADVFILPSLSEGRPNTVLEALASGTAIIATDIPGTREIIENNKNGILIEPKNSLDIVRSVISLIENKKLLEKLRKQSRKSLMDKGLNWEKCADNYIKIYNKFV